jgi:hypothetical protein
MDRGAKNSGPGADHRQDGAAAAPKRTLPMDQVLSLILAIIAIGQGDSLAIGIGIRTIGYRSDLCGV